MSSLNKKSSLIGKLSDSLKVLHNKQQYLFTMKYLLLSLLVFFVSFNVQAQSDIYIVDGYGNLYTINPATCQSTLIGNTGQIITDIAINPLDGLLYGIGNYGVLIIIDTSDASVTELSTVNNYGYTDLLGINALTFDENGNLYGATNFDTQIIQIDISDGSIIQTWNNNTYNASAGDLTFYDGNMYMTSSGGALVQFDPNDFSQAEVVGLFANGVLFFGINTSTYLDNCTPEVFAFADNDVYLLDSNNLLDATLICPDIVNIVIYGAASINENLPINCNENPCYNVSYFDPITCECDFDEITCANGATTVLPCDDGNPDTINDTETILDCDGSVCTPCEGFTDTGYDCPIAAFNTIPDFCNNDNSGGFDLSTLQTNPDIIGIWNINNLNGYLTPIVLFGNTMDYGDADPGAYELVFTIDDPGLDPSCDDTFTFEIILSASFESTENLAACEGESANFNGDLILAGTTEIYNLTSINGCDSTITVIVDELANYSENIELQSCNNNSILFDGVPLYIGDVQDFNYSNAEGCDSILTVSVIAVTEITNTENVEVCDGDSYDYNGTLIPSGSSESFTLQSTQGCDSILTIEVSGILPVEEDIALEACPGESIEFNGQDLSIGETFTQNLLTEEGCDSIINVTVSAAPTVNIQALTQVTVTEGLSEVLNVQSDAQDPMYEWTPTSGLSCLDCNNPVINPTQDIAYMVTVTDQETGCSAEHTFLITVTEPVINDLYVPNAFSPNSDGNNDFLQAFAIGELIDFEMYIYNRWGELMFFSNDITESWDGTYKGKEQDLGVFVFYAVGTFANDVQIIRKGNATLIR